MANIPGAEKRNRQSTKRNLRNRATKSAIKTQIKKVHALVPAGDAAKTDAEVRIAVKKLDQAASKGVMHKNKASRLKSRLAKKVKALKTAKA